MKKGIYCIEWEDACSSSDIYDEEGDYTLIHCKTVGHLVKYTKKTILLCGMIFDDRIQKHIHIIPRKSIKRITRLVEEGGMMPHKSGKKGYKSTKKHPKK